MALGLVVHAAQSVAVFGIMAAAWSRLLFERVIIWIGFTRPPGQKWLKTYANSHITRWGRALACTCLGYLSQQLLAKHCHLTTLVSVWPELFASAAPSRSPATAPQHPWKILSWLLHLMCPSTRSVIMTRNPESEPPKGVCMYKWGRKSGQVRKACASEESFACVSERVALGGGFNFLFSPIAGEMIQVDWFFTWVETTN